MIILCTLPSVVFGQQWDTSVSLESSAGYYTNTYFDDYFSEWNSTVNNGYGLLSLTGQTFWYRGRHSLDITAGGIYENFSGDLMSRGGAVGLLTYKYRFSNKWSGGINLGGNYLNASYGRSMAWLQPRLTWRISPFTSLQVGAGSSFRSYNFADSLAISKRNDFYGLTFQTWPAYHWKVQAGLYSGLNHLGSPGEGFSSSTGISYYFSNGTRLKLDARFEQYRFIATVEENTGSSSTVVRTDRIMRGGLEVEYPLNSAVSFFSKAEMMSNQSPTANDAMDYHLSAGVRLSFHPRFGRRRRAVEPEWQQLQDRKMVVRVKYKGEGLLYLVGDFNQWRKPGIPLRKDSGNTYAAEFETGLGAHEYKILVVKGSSEKWLTFSDDTYTVADGFGGKNAVVLVR